MIKTKMKLGIIGLLSLFIALTSCKKDEEMIKKDDAVQEGLMSATGGQNLIIEESEIEGEVIFHKSYGAKYSEAEIEAMWQKDLNEFNANYSQEKAARNTFRHHVITKTSTATDAETDGIVEVTIRYRTHYGTRTKVRAQLDNSGNDRERGQTDHYIVQSNLSTATNWVELKDAWFYLKGTDGWKPYNLRIDVDPGYQTYPAVGLSRISVFPNQWLDSNCSDCWDYYYTTDKGSGRLTFQ